MSVRLGTIPIDASVSIRPTDDSSVYEAVLHCRFPGLHNVTVSGGTSTSIAGDGTVLGKIV
jgi:outer membrane lipoprotein SlyB